MMIYNNLLQWGNKTKIKAKATLEKPKRQSVNRGLETLVRYMHLCISNYCNVNSRLPCIPSIRISVMSEIEPIECSQFELKVPYNCCNKILHFQIQSVIDYGYRCLMAHLFGQRNYSKGFIGRYEFQNYNLFLLSNLECLNT